ncbi:MAG: membrane integrity-associated transporter subunit PqiC [Candidatus Accumulibacter sp.]|jgi:uncharacterized lipoprotein YmbA|nr:membrane integrity-associated transporter subunit PqiC [Candidatus Accumulibacter necessarius]
MRRARSRICGLAFALAAALSGCASPPSQFYTLAATARPEAGASPASYVVAVDSVGLPGTVDRPQFVVQKGPNRVAFDEFNRWAAPLATNIARTVAENLVVLLGTPQVVSGPLAPSFKPAYRVTVDIQRFESVPGEAATFDALWQVRRVGADADAGATIGRTTLREPVQGEGFDALAAAHSRAIAGMSRDIAAAIRAEAGR